VRIELRARDGFDLLSHGWTPVEGDAMDHRREAPDGGGTAGRPRGFG
jgi:hypothetical protein